ncbi:DnaJ domain-containing protein [Curtobacterium ammoniigenes]|uniref:DnaJ domain-containing protein n=1 Tax=Curtobacterium ammoniigenes TaxID=395387 RepID=UPI00082D29E8|nr:DnaJ domain-containing protein [Curtobacterium ammoniigenes]
MSDSPADATPYEVLGVLPTADDESLRRAYRRAARERHPDLGGDPHAFRQLQDAWEQIGTPAARRAYDAGATSRASSRVPAGGRADGAFVGFAPPSPRRDSRPRARSYGHPGGRSREIFLAALREWVGLGDPIDDPYDPALIRSAPPGVRRLIAEALAEESTAGLVADLGIAVTVWHDVDAGPDGKLDHIVLSPNGLWAIESIDWGGRVRVEHGEIVGPTLAPGERPVHALVRASRAVQRVTRIRFTGRLLVVPDSAVDDDIQVVGHARKPTAFVVRRSALRAVLNTPAAEPGTVDVFAIRDRLQQTVRFI